MQQRPVDAARGQPGGAPDQDFEYTWSDRDDTAASYDHEPVTAPIPIPAAEVQHLVPDQPDDYAWDEAIDFWESVFGEGSTEAQAIAHCIVDGACD